MSTVSDPPLFHIGSLRRRVCIAMCVDYVQVFILANLCWCLLVSISFLLYLVEVS